MKSRFFIYTFLLVIISIITNAQTTSSTSGLRNVPTDVSNAEKKVALVTNDAGRYFKQGLLNLQDNRRPQARADFDKSVEVFLNSTLDVRKNIVLQNCYTQLVETIYLIEFPTSRQPANIRGLATTCSWDIRNETIDSVAKLLLPTNQQNQSNENSMVASIATIPPVPQVGFSDQGFEPSQLDELAKLELTSEEVRSAETPEAQQQYQFIQAAVNRGSLGFSFEMNGMVQQFLSYYQGRGRATMETGLYRSGMFTRMARKIFREEGVPENVVWLGQVESAWKPTAQSWAAAAGLWQFIPGTGTRFGLRINGSVDERRSFEKATRASAQYLKFLANRYNGNWELAMGAYNCGEGNVDRAIRKAGKANFWAAYPYLPKETRNYVPNILATILIANNPQKYGFGHIGPAQPLQYDQVRVPSSTSLSLIAQSSDTTIDYLRFLNPELRTNTTPNEPYIVRVPAGKANATVASLRKIPNSGRSSANLANVNVGENYRSISNRTGVSVEQLRVANGNAVPKGKVVVPGNGVTKTSLSRPKNPTSSPTTSTLKIVKALPGDTVTKIAARYGVSAAEVGKQNGLTLNSALAAGREIRLPLK
jgi:Transglycosylase SLT domain/LysM domain